MRPPKIPVISAYGIVQRRLDKRFVIIERRCNGRALFDLPGGERKVGEKMLQTIVRVVAKEANIVFEPTNYIGFGYHIYDSGGSDRVCNLRSTFSGTTADTNALSDGKLANVGVRWMHLPELLASRDCIISNDAITRLREYISGARLPLTQCGEVDD